MIFKRLRGNSNDNIINKIALLISILFVFNFIFPNCTYASSIENLDEMMARKARYATNPWPTDLLEDPNNFYIWQPETLCYNDVTTGHEVWVLVHGPDIQEIYSAEHGTNAWSYDGSRIGFFSAKRPTKNPLLSKNEYHYRWVVNTDGSKLRCVEGYGRRDTPFDGFGWAHTENAYYSFGSGPAEASDSTLYKLFKMVIDENNVVKGNLILDTSSINTYKKGMVKNGISSNDSWIVFRDAIPDNKRLLNTPNPIPTTEVYFAKLGLNPTMNYHWGVARHIGPSINNWADPYGQHLPSHETHFHDVWSPGPTGSFIIGQYSGGGGLFNLFKNHGSANDGGPLWQDWNGSSFGNDEIKVISSGAGTPSNPYGNPYFGHPAWDRWGRYGIVGTYTHNPKPGTRIYDIQNNKLLSHYVFAYGKYDGQHHSWTGWTDYVIAVEPNWPSGNLTAYFITANKWNSDYTKAFHVVNTHYQEPNKNYNAYPRPSQSPDGTKVAFAQYFLNNSQAYPYIAWAVVYYPYPPVNVRAQKNGNFVRLTWTRPSYTTRGWPNEATDPPPKAREIKGYHVWVSDNGVDGWTELTTTAIPTEYYDISQPNGTTKYYAVTSEEYSRLESRKLSEIRKVTLDLNGNLTDSQFAPEGKTGFWTKPPYAPSNFTVEKQSTPGQYLLEWTEPNDSKIRYYNIYYSTTGTPPVDQRYKIASVPVGTSKYLDWLADPSLPGYYRITSVDRQGNEGTEPFSASLLNISPPPTIVPSPVPEPAPEPSQEPSTEPPQVVEPSPTPTPEPTPTPVAEPPKPQKEKEHTNNKGGDKENSNSKGAVVVAVSEITSDGEAIGNLKKYEIVTPTNPTNPSNPSNPTNQTNQTNPSNPSNPVIVDAKNTPVLDSSNQIKESSTSAWSSTSDGNQVSKGGVGEVLLKRENPRKIITNLSGNDLMDESNQFSVSNEKITPEVLGLPPNDEAQREKLIQYVQGYDVFKKDGKESPLQKRKWILGAIVNSRPLVIHYGNGVSVIYAGANDGMLHAFDNKTGEELWGFIPDVLLSRIKELPQGNGLKYFVDGSPKAYLTQSKKIIIFGLRRGGSHYYALDVSNPQSPKFLWKVGPETPGFSELSLTFSEPHFGKVRYGKGSKVVCIFGGGYDENQDSKTGSSGDKKGRAVYIVDLFSGQQIWRWDYAKDSEVKYSIPSSVARLDVNGDGYIDRLYVGDTGGRMWRFDLTGSDPRAWKGRIVFNTNLGFRGSSKKKIFHPPDVTLEKGGYEIVFFGTGDREHPNEKTSFDQFYAFIDRGERKVLTEADLVNISSDLNTLQKMNNKEGWYINLDKGEKVLSSPLVAFGVVYFTTFTPSIDNNGIARIYALDYRSGNPILNLNSENDSQRPQIDLSDRSKVIGRGIPSGTILSAYGKRPIAFAGFPGGLYPTPLRGRSVIIPISWREVAKR